MKKHEKIFHKSANVSPSNLDMDNSGGATDGLDINKIPSFGIQRVKDKKSGKTKIQLNTPIQPTPRQPRDDSKYDDRFSKKNYNLS